MTVAARRALWRVVVAGALAATAPAFFALPAVAATGDRGARSSAGSWAVLEAQVTPPTRVARRGWTVVRVSKWALLGATVGLGYYALQQSTRADRAYGDLRHLCTEAPTACMLDAGRYPDAGAEGLYATSLRHDRRAQTGILGGQATLLASAALFVYDLRNGRPPENIPFPGVPARSASAEPATTTPARDAMAPIPTAPVRRFPPAAAAPPLAALGAVGGAR